jgi:hypothetical protein
VKRSNTLDLGHNAVAPALAYATALYATLVQFGKTSDLLSEPLSFSGTQNAGRIRNRTLRASYAKD